MMIKHKLTERLRLRQEGFTLIELLVVVAIIGILVAIAIPQFSAYRNKANNNAAEVQLKNLATSMESYYATL